MTEHLDPSRRKALAVLGAISMAPLQGWAQAFPGKPIKDWPARIAPGGVSQQHCMTMDWSATLLDAAGVNAAPDDATVSLGYGAKDMPQR